MGRKTQMVVRVDAVMDIIISRLPRMADALSLVPLSTEAEDILLNNNGTVHNHSQSQYKTGKGHKVHCESHKIHKQDGNEKSIWEWRMQL